ncbi:hypothetical protein QR680_011041 [Steinernema hermaphroditum]|uniref:Uncharacterized protein n=1 Tax=Steinernema hermaphroditum TaxID=289476 RepID=A0AA39MCN9_9BILA|nr:hypothetical protein QR680_011041 [Steinernema hermaphroditum]
MKFLLLPVVAFVAHLLLAEKALLTPGDAEKLSSSEPCEDSFLKGRVLAGIKKQEVYFFRFGGSNASEATNGTISEQMNQSSIAMDGIFRQGFSSFFQQGSSILPAKLQYLPLLRVSDHWIGVFFFSENGFLCYDFKQIPGGITAKPQYSSIQLGKCVEDVFRFWDTVVFVDGDQVKLASRGIRFSQFGEQMFAVRGVFSFNSTSWVYASINERRARHFHHYELYARPMVEHRLAVYGMENFPMVDEGKFHVVFNHNISRSVMIGENSAKEEKICSFARGGDGVVENLILFPRDVPAS